MSAWAARCVDSTTGCVRSLVGAESGFRPRVLVQAGGKRQGVFHGQFGAGSDREVSGVRGISEQEDVSVCTKMRRTVTKFSHRVLFAKL